MSVEIKTPTRIQFEHTEFMCGERQTSSPGVNSKSSSHDIILENSQSNSTATTSKTDVSLITTSQTSANNLAGKNSAKGSEDETDCNKNYGRKRRMSQGHHSSNSWIYKRRRHSMKSGHFELPSQFLFGGNISDPLNLKSFCDDDVGRLLNQVTPQSSPLPAPTHRMHVAVFTPANIKDPLNLSAADDESPIIGRSAGNRRKKRKKSKGESLLQLNESAEEHVVNLASAVKSENVDSSSKRRDNDKIVSPIVVSKKKGFSTSDQSKRSDDKNFDGAAKKRKRHKHRNSSDTDNVTAIDNSNGMNTSHTPKGSKETTEIVMHDSSKIVDDSLMIMKSSLAEVKTDTTARTLPSSSPQKRTKRHSSGTKSRPDAVPKPLVQQQPKLLPRQHKFMYGNYNRYYGYRNPCSQEDHRIDCLKPDWFVGKRVLDIGCNVGHVTLSIAFHFRPLKIIGMDIDGHLISVARKNIRHYLKGGSDSARLPVSVCVNKGPLAASPTFESNSNPFPANVMFIQGNYVMDDDKQLAVQQEEYDVILALSITKWIHLNWGDEAMKRVFKRMFRQLKPGGMLILEPQSWSSYAKKKKLTETIYKNYQTIQFKPQAFKEYLLSSHVGFSSCRLIDVPQSHSKGFQRAMELYMKGGTSTANTSMSTANTGTATANTCTSTANTGTSTAKTETSTANTETSTANTETSTANTETSTANTGTSTANTGTSTANTGMSTANIEMSTSSTAISAADTGACTTPCSATAAIALEITTVRTRSPSSLLDVAPQPQVQPKTSRSVDIASGERSDTPCLPVTRLDASCTDTTPAAKETSVGVAQRDDIPSMDTEQEGGSGTVRACAITAADARIGGPAR